jgi:hypothetical protein
LTEGAEDCDPPDHILCNKDCQSIICGDGDLEGDEECEPPSACGCDAQCRVVLPENDSCDSPIAVSDGTTLFDNCAASLSVPNARTDCPEGGAQKDVWFCYTATCTGLVELNTCGSSLDVNLSVFQGCQCPASDPISCAASACQNDTPSADARFTAGAGGSYLLRVGNTQGVQGDAALVITCTAGLVCTEGAGDCFADNGTPGCERTSCCAEVCAIDPFCCGDHPKLGGAWDQECAALASLPALDSQCQP